VLLDKAAKFGHPGSTGEIRIPEDFQGFCGFSFFFENFQDFLRIFPKNLRNFWIPENVIEISAISRHIVFVSVRSPLVNIQTLNNLLRNFPGSTDINWVF
jgi:hypothetical protein